MRLCISERSEAIICNGRVIMGERRPVFTGKQSFPDRDKQSSWLTWTAERDLAVREHSRERVLRRVVECKAQGVPEPMVFANTAACNGRVNNRCEEIVSACGVVQVEIGTCGIVPFTRADTGFKILHQPIAMYLIWWRVPRFRHPRRRNMIRRTSLWHGRFLREYPRVQC